MIVFNLRILTFTAILIASVPVLLHHPALAREAGESSTTPFPYSTAEDPPREPQRRPVPCSTFSRETDGATTCIGIDERTRETRRRIAKPEAIAPQRRQAELRPRPQRPRVRESERLTDPRYDPQTIRMVERPRASGLIPFLSSLFSR